MEKSNKIKLLNNHKRRYNLKKLAKLKQND